LIVALLSGMRPQMRLQKNFASKPFEFLCRYKVLIIVRRRLDIIEKITQERTEEVINAEMYVTDFTIS